VEWLRALFESAVEWRIDFLSSYEQDLLHLLTSAAGESKDKAVRLSEEEKRIRNLLKTGRMDKLNRPHKIEPHKGPFKAYTKGNSEVWDMHLLSPKSKYVILVAKYPKERAYILLTIGEEAYINKKM